MYKRIVIFLCFFPSVFTYSQEYDSIRYELNQQYINHILTNTYQANTIVSINELINNIKDNGIIIVNNFRYRYEMYSFITSINLDPSKKTCLYTGDMRRIDSTYIDHIGIPESNLFINYFSNNYDSGTITIINVKSGDIVGLDVLNFFSFSMQQAKNNFNSFPIIVRPLSQIFQFIIRAEINWIETRSSQNPTDE